VQGRVDLGVSRAAPGDHARPAGPHRGRRVGVIAGEDPQAGCGRDVTGQLARGRAADLGSGQAGRLRHAGEEGGGHGQAGPFRKNIGVELGPGSGVPDGAVVGDQLIGPGRQVIGRDRRDAGGSQGDRRLGQPAGVPGVRGADVRDDAIGAGLGERQFEQRQPFRVLQGRELPGRPGDEQPVHQAGDELVQGLVGVEIELPSGPEERRDRGEDNRG
jgi:hypothetical protein